MRMFTIFYDFFWIIVGRMEKKKNKKIVKKIIHTFLDCFSFDNFCVCVEMVKDVIFQFVIFYFSPEMPFLVFVHALNKPFRSVGVALYTFQIPFEEVDKLLKWNSGDGEIQAVPSNTFLGEHLR